MYKNDSHSITDLFSTHIGLRQGDVTSSINFLFFLNDLADYLLERGAEGLEIGHLYLLILLYADDLCIFDKTARGLQMKINIFATYCEKWGLIVNIDKSKIMFFRKSLNQLVNYTWKLNGEILECVNSYKYLGLIIHSTCSTSPMKTDIASRASRAIFSLISNLKRFGTCPAHIILKLFDAKIVPILLYGGEIWGLDGCDEIEKIANNFYRNILGLHKNASTVFARGDLGRYSMTQSVMVKVIKYWVKLTQCKHLSYADEKNKSHSSHS